MCVCVRVRVCVSAASQTSDRGKTRAGNIRAPGFFSSGTRETGNQGGRGFRLGMLALHTAAYLSPHAGTTPETVVLIELVRTLANPELKRGLIRTLRKRITGNETINLIKYRQKTSVGISSISSESVSGYGSESGYGSRV